MQRFEGYNGQWIECAPGRMQVVKHMGTLGLYGTGRTLNASSSMSTARDRWGTTGASGFTVSHALPPPSM